MISKCIEKITEFEKASEKFMKSVEEFKKVVEEMGGPAPTDEENDLDKMGKLPKI